MSCVASSLAPESPNLPTARPWAAGGVCAAWPPGSAELLFFKQRLKNVKIGKWGEMRENGGGEGDNDEDEASAKILKMVR